jgi:hypothetical protein
VKPAVRWGLVVLGAALLLLILDFWWFEAHRSGYPFDIDEAGYTVFGVVDYIGLHSGGISGWWEAIQHQPTFAPLVPALTSLTVYVHQGVLNGFAVLALFALLLTLLVYLLAERLVGPRLGAFAAIVTATLPGTIAFSREYIFALPTATFLVGAVYAILRSDGLRSRRWAIACGVSIGLMMLSRTMAIAYVPGILLAGIVPMLLRDGRLGIGRKLLNLALLMLAAVAVAATWYARNLSSVVDYLTSYGYGHQSKFYGAQHSTLSWGRFRGVAEHMTAEDLYVPLAALVLVALIVLAVALVRQVRQASDRRATLERIASSDAFGVCLVFAVGYAALMSSQNGGDGFTIPIAVLLPSIGAVALRRFPRAIVPAVALVGVIALVNLVSTSTISDWSARSRFLSIPGLAEELPVTKGEPKAVFAIRQQFPGPEDEFTRRDSAWLRADRKLDAIIAGYYGPEGEAPIVAFASRNRALNTNTVQLASILKYQRGIPLEQFEIEEESEDTVAEYGDLLEEGKIGSATLLVTSSSEEGDFPVPITQTKAETAARALGFRRAQSMPLPDGRELYVWKLDERTPKSSPRAAPKGGA